MRNRHEGGQKYLLGKQIRFDLLILRSNPFKYLLFVCQITLVCLIGYYTRTKQDMIFMLIEFVMLLIMILFMVSISTVFEKLSLEFTVKKLAFYPTKKVINLFSKAILLLMFVVLQIAINCFSVYLGALTSRDGFNSIALNHFNFYALIAGVFAFATIWGIHTVRGILMMTCFSIPIFLIVFVGTNFTQLDIVDIEIVAGLFVFNLVINVFNYVKLNV